MRAILFRLGSNLRRSWLETLALLVVVALTGLTVVGLVAGAVRTWAAPGRYERARGAVPDANVEQFSGSPRTEELASLPSVRAAESVTFVFAGVVPLDGEAPVEAIIMAGSPSAFASSTVQGREPDSSIPGEFAVSQTFMDLTGAELGQRFQLMTLTQSQADEAGFDTPEPAGPTLEATLVGVFTGASDIQDPAAIAVFPTSLLSVGDVGVSASQIGVTLRRDRTLADLRAELDTLPDGDQFGINPFEVVPGELRDAVRARAAGLLVLAVIVGVATLVVVGQLLGRQVRRDEDEVALTSMGMTSLQLRGDQLARAVVPVLGGAVVAGGAAFALSGLFPMGFVVPLDPDTGPRLETLGHLLGPIALVVGLLGWVFVTLTVAGRRGRRPMPSWILTMVAPKVRPLSAATGMRFAFGGSGPGSGRGSVAAPLLGIVAVVAVLIGAMSVGDSLGRLVGDPARYGQFDLAVGQGGNVIPDTALQIVVDDPGVSGLMLGTTVFVSVGSVALDVTGLRPVMGDLTPEPISGRMPQGNDEIALGLVSARQLGIEVGDDLAVSGTTGARTFRVSGFAMIPSIEGGDGIGLGAVVTDEGLFRLDPSATMGSAVIELGPDADAGTVERLGAATGLAIGAPAQLAPIGNLERIRAIPFLVAASLIVLAVLNLAHQLIVSTRRHRHDIAILRALGADRGSMTAAVHVQASVYSVLAAILALPVGLLAGRWVLRALMRPTGAADGLSVPFALLGATALVLLALANVAASVASRRARNEPAAVVLRQP